MLIEMTAPNFSYRDDRGELTQLVREGYKQFNIIYSKKNVARGNHYHKNNSEAFYVIMGRVRLVVNNGELEEEYEFQQGDMFLIPPNIVHSFYYTEDTWLAGMYNNGVENIDGTKDIYTGHLGTVQK